MATRLKVFRTPIGFHDAYVAVPSRKAALAAGGADGDLFARGGAEEVTDPALTEAPLADPGKVIKVPRGSAEQHLAAMADADRKKPPSHGAPKRRSAAPPPAAPRRPPPPRPSRSDLAAAEADRERQKREHDGQMAVLEAERTRIQAQIAALRKAGEQQRDRLDRRIDSLRADYEAAMDRWRSDS
jgi:hypothetical protein